MDVRIVNFKWNKTNFNKACAYRINKIFNEFTLTTTTIAKSNLIWFNLINLNTMNDEKTNKHLS